MSEYLGYWKLLEQCETSWLLVCRIQLSYTRRVINTRPVTSVYAINNTAVKAENVPSGLCAKRRLKSACASGQSNQSSLSAWRTLHSWLSKKRPVTILIRLRECAGWSESSLGAPVRLYLLVVHMYICISHRWRKNSHNSRPRNSPVLTTKYALMTDCPRFWIKDGFVYYKCL